MDDWIFGLAGVLVLFAVVAAYKWLELSRMKELRELVAWSVTGGYHPPSGVNSYDRELWTAILVAQHQLSIPKEYWIDEKEDFEICHEIIKEYQADIARKYFLDQLSLIKSKYRVSREDYFMVSFYNFLTKRECYDEVVGHAMHKERIAYTDYGYGNYDATYLLSDFGYVYHKLLYTTFCYCKNSKVINDEPQYALGEDRENGIRTVLDTKQLGIWCHN